MSIRRCLLYIAAENGQDLILCQTHESRRRTEPLALRSHLEQLIAEAEALSVGLCDDDILLRVAKQVTELRSVLTEVERKLTTETRDQTSSDVLHASQAENKAPVYRHISSPNLPGFVN